MNKLELSWDDVEQRAYFIASEIKKRSERHRSQESFTPLQIYGVPRGGVYAALLIGIELAKSNIPFQILKESNDDTIFVDDIVDSGKTREKIRVEMEYDEIPFYALVDYTGRDLSMKGTWIVFPWEKMNKEMGPEENIRRIIEYIGDDPKREGLRETPNRVIKSYEKLFSGYQQEPKEHIKIFTDGSCDEMVVIKDIEFYSCCEHHMLPFFGKAHIAYIPDGRIIGISKVIRILEIYARRLQIQERLCQQITSALDEILQPLGSACVLEGQHFCMTSRGVEKQNTIVITSSLTGVFRKNEDTRNEFLSMIK